MSGPIIKLRCTSWGQLSAIYERDLKRGALFIRTPAQLPLGKDARVDIIMPSGTVVHVEGRVARLVPPGENGPGIELILTKLPPSAMWMIESALGKSPPAEELHALDAPLDDGSAAAEEQLVVALENELRAFRTMQPHQILGVKHDASEATARAAFAELSKKYHPDRFARFESDLARRVASDVFVVLRDAYRKVADPARRHPVGPAPTKHPTPARGIPRIADDLAPRLAPPSPPSLSQPAPLVPAAQLRVSSPALPVGAPVVTFTKARPPSARGDHDPDARTPTPMPIGPMPHAAPPRAAAQPPSAPPQPPAPPAPSASPSPAGQSPRLSADYLFGDLGPPPAAAAAGPLALDDPEVAEADAHLEAGRLDAALAGYDDLVRMNPTHRGARAGRELVYGLRKSAAGDREGAAFHFEQALEIEPWSDRAARELAALRRAATERGKGLFAKLLGKGGVP